MTKPQQVQQGHSPGSATPTTSKPLSTTSTGNAAASTTTTSTTMENGFQQQEQNMSASTSAEPSNKDPPVESSMVGGTENRQPHVDEEDSDMDYEDGDDSERDSAFGDDEEDESDMDSSFVYDAELELQAHLAERDAVMDGPFDDSEDDEEHGELGYWAKRCSICFDATMDICLDPCRDQYCYECFQRYVTEVVMASWGLGVATLKCPVCLMPIPQSQWSKFVPQSVADHYNRFNQPYRSFTRCCPRCEKEAKPCDYSLKVVGVNYMKRIRDMLRSLTMERYDGRTQDNDPTVLSGDGNRRQIYTTLRSLLLQLDEENIATSLLDIYRDTLNVLSTVKQTFAIDNKSSPSLVSERCHAISSAFILLDMAPETWKQMQFIYIKHFPNTTCDHCHLEFCLQCGYEAHGKLTCEEAMRQLVGSASQDQEAVMMTRWCLNNSRRCPNCAIMIDRNEGCNRVDCSLCGYCFCWACRHPWSNKCGFFQCQEVEESSTKTIPGNAESGKDQKSELGVPDISSIEARLATNTSMVP